MAPMPRVVHECTGYQLASARPLVDNRLINMKLSPSIEALIQGLRHLPGVGPKPQGVGAKLGA